MEKQAEEPKTDKTSVKKGSFFENTRQNLKNCLKDIHKKDILMLVAVSLLVNFVVETLALIKYDGILGCAMKLLPDFGNASVGSNNAFAGFIGIFIHPLKVFNDPLIFLYNSCIVMVLLSFALLFKKRYFVMTILSAVWLGLGMANFVILSYRVTPFSVVELKLIDAAVGVMKSYVTGKVFIVVAIVILAALATLVFVFIKSPKITKVNRFSSALIIACSFLLAATATYAGQRSGMVADKLPNLSVNYQEYGFVYCFVSSFNTGIGKPRSYSEKKVKEIQDDTKKKLNGESDETVTTEAVATQKPIHVTHDAMRDEDMPNVIFLQLESFFDITALDGLELSEDPIPTFRKYMQDYASGYLDVAVVGAGTANTEFEIITGMNLDFFGPGEYPYKTVLKDKCCETICYNLKNHGYTTQAMHNNRATFYGRNSVFRRFGFDIFTSVELMDVQEYTENGWAKDKILTGEILKSLRATEGRDYLYTISVQGHGEYPDTKMAEKPVITVKGGISDEARKNRIEYYVNQIHEMDQFLAELTEELEKNGEKTILVAYGDHLPNLDITEEQLANKNMFQTQYFIWNNFGLELEKEDLETYQLSAKVLGAIGVTDGIINAYHQANWNKRDTKEYLDNLEILGYDMFYGDNTATGGRNVYEPTKIQYGVENVEITDVYRDQSDMDYLIVKGKNFTDYSIVLVNGEKVSSQFLDAHTLRVRLDKQMEDILVKVQQSYKGKLILQNSNEITYEAAEEKGMYEDGDDETTPDDPEEDDFAGLLEEGAAILDDENIDGENENGNQ